MGKSVTTINFDIPCARCERSLQGRKLNGKCPASGLPVQESLNLPLINAADLTVCGDVGCVHCGYNLRTLSIGSVCPECGQPVAASLQRDDLHLAPLPWLKRLHSGTKEILVGLCCPLVAAFFFGASQGSQAFLLLAVPVILITPVPIMAGAFMICEPRPSAAVRHPLANPGWRMGILAVFALVIFGPACVLGYAEIALPSVIAIVAGAAIYPARATSRLARWAQNKALDTLAKVMLGLLVLWVVFFVAVAIGAILSPQGQVTLLENSILGPGGVVTYLLAFLICFWLHHVLAETIERQ